MRYIRFRQEALRSSSYRQEQRTPQWSTTGNNIGSRVIPHPTFPDGPWQMAEMYPGATEVVRTHGKPHQFTTRTCNPSWPDIKEAILPNQTEGMRPDIAARVFRLQHDALLKDLAPNAVLGKVAARLFVAEFQKSGLPRAHILRILANENAPRATDDYDDNARAAIPGHEKGHVIWHAVATSRMHGPCGSLIPNAALMEGGDRRKGHAERFSDSAVAAKRDPEYKRTGDGRTVLKRRGIWRTSGSCLIIPGSPQRPTPTLTTRFVAPCLPPSVSINTFTNGFGELLSKSEMAKSKLI